MATGGETFKMGKTGVVWGGALHQGGKSGDNKVLRVPTCPLTQDPSKGSETTHERRKMGPENSRKTHLSIVATLGL